MKNKSMYFILISCLLLTGCSKSYDQLSISEGISSSTVVVQDNDAGYSDNMMVESYVESYDKISPEAAPQGMSSDAIVDTGQLNAKVIKNGYLNIETLTFEETIKEVLNYTSQNDGFVENMSKNSYNDRKSSNFTIRIPNKNFDSIMNMSMKSGTILESTISTQDITSVYIDNENRLSSLQVRHDRLLDFLTKSDDLDKIFKIEKELASVNYEIESIKGTLNHYDNLVNYSTITVNVLEVKNISPSIEEKSFIQNFKYQAKEALLFAKTVLEMMIIQLMYLIVILVLVILPTVAVGSLLLILAVKIVRKIKKFIKGKESSKTKK